MSDFNSAFICPSCGSTGYRKEGRMLKCQHCGNFYRESLMDNPIFFELQQAMNDRQEANFDVARRKYEALISKNKESSALEEAYWGQFLCEQYVIFYQNDAGDSIPSFWNINNEPCTSSKSYQKALEYGKQSGNADNYERLAELIQEYKLKYKRVCKEFPDGHQIFICFKDSGTDDANLGYKIYNEFSKHYRIFFSRESLNTISGNDYEPYIYHALKTAKVMIVLCSDKKNLESKWVHNEWWRFWKFSKGTDKTIIPVCRQGFSTSALPDELRNCQAHAEDIGLISVLSTHLASIFKNDSNQAIPLTSFEKKISEVETTLNSGKFDDAKIMAEHLVRDSTGRPYDNISALLLQARVLSGNYRNLKHHNAKTVITKAKDLAKANDISIKDLPQYRPYHAAIVKNRIKIALLSLLCTILITGASIGTVLFLQDPYVDIYVSGHPDSIEITYGENPISAIPEIVAVSKKGNETKIELNESMISGFDPTKIGMQAVTISYGEITIQVNIDVKKIRLSSPTLLTVTDGKLTWETVSQAESYTLMINNQIVEGITSDSYAATVFDEPGVYSVKIKAVGNGAYSYESDYSNPISVIKLKEASNISINGLTLSWAAVYGCSKYDVYLNDTLIASSAFNSYTLSRDALVDGKNVLYAVPVDASNIKIAKDLSEDEIDNYSHNSEVVCYTSASAPTVTWSNDTLSWDAALNNTTYSVYLNGTLLKTVSGTSYKPDTTAFHIGENKITVTADSSFYFVEDTATPAPLELVRFAQALEPSLSGTTLSWTSVAGCTQYDVYLNGQKIGVTEYASYNVPASAFFNGKNTFYAIPVNVGNVALLDGNVSDFEHNGELVCYKYENLPNVTWDGEKFTWPSVLENALYSVVINGKIVETTSALSFVPTENDMQIGENIVYVTVENACYITASPIDHMNFTDNGKITVQKLSAPSGVRIQNMVLSWNAVNGALEYEIYKNGVFLKKVNTTSYAIVSDEIKGEDTVFTVKAFGDSKTSPSEISSEYAQITYLQAPTGISLEENILRWNTVNGATGYEVYSNGTLIHTSDSSTTMVNLMGMMKIGTYRLSIVAKGDGNSIFSSAKSMEVSYTVTQNIIYITTEEELKNIVTNLSETYILGNDITLTSPWTPLGTTAKPFVGQFNGGGFTIKGLTFSSVSGQGTGLFGVIGESGIVENLKIQNVSAADQAHNCIGALAGINYGTVRQIEVSGTVSSSGNYIGGIVGRNEGSIYECINRANVQGNRNVGGVVGKVDISSASHQLHNCSNYGTVSGDSHVGGVLGDVLVSKKSTLYGLVNEGAVRATDNYAAGCIGYVSGSNGQMVTLNACSNSGSITASDRAAGCFNTGTYVTVVTNNINDPSLNCKNTGLVSVTSGSNKDDIYTK